jgi:hypothetical protein
MRTHTEIGSVTARAKGLDMIQALEDCHKYLRGSDLYPRTQRARRRQGCVRRRGQCAGSANHGRHAGVQRDRRCRRHGPTVREVRRPGPRIPAGFKVAPVGIHARIARRPRTAALEADVRRAFRAMFQGRRTVRVLASEAFLTGAGARGAGSRSIRGLGPNSARANRPEQADCAPWQNRP